jgi:hypothetical protein
MTQYERLRAYLEALEHAAPADLPPRPSVSPRPSWLRFGAPIAIVATIGLVIGVWLPNWLETIRPMASPDAASVSQPQSPDASRIPTELVWTSNPFVDPDTERVPRRVTSLGGRLLITGGTGSGPSAWYSDDGGATWTRSGFIVRAIPGAVSGHSAMGPVAESGGTLVSISEPGINVGSWGETWLSGDRGETWALMDSGPHVLTDIAGGPGGFVAVGGGGPTGGDLSAVLAHVAVWYSSDGSAWHQADDHPTFAGASVTGLAEHDGHFVAVGATSTEEEANVAAIWESSDGVTWNPVPMPPGHGPIADISAGPDGFVAIGGTRIPWQHTTPTVWRSRDGVTWQHEPALISSGAAIDEQVALEPTAVTSGPAGVLLRGMSPSVRTVSSFTWLLEPGSASWELRNPAFIADATTVDDGFVAVSVCPTVVGCEATFSVVFGLPAGRAPTDVSVKVEAPPSNEPQLSCGELDAATCDQVVAAADRVLSAGATPTSITLGTVVCLDGRCPSFDDVDDAIGVTIEIVARPWPLQLNCLLHAGQWLCVAVALPLVAEPELGVSYAATIETHCGLTAVEFDGDRWAIEGRLDDGSGNPPEGFGNPTDSGTVTLVSLNEGMYRSFYGVERRITRGGGLPPVEGCI